MEYIHIEILSYLLVEPSSVGGRFSKILFGSFVINNDQTVKAHGLSLDDTHGLQTIFIMDSYCINNKHLEIS